MGSTIISIECSSLEIGGDSSSLKVVQNTRRKNYMAYAFRLVRKSLNHEANKPNIFLTTLPYLAKT
jgi:hypothetical protein